MSNDAIRVESPMSYLSAKNPVAEIDREYIMSLQEKCVTRYNCLVPDNTSLTMDQALVPLKTIHGVNYYIPDIDIDIDKVAGEEDLDVCLLNPHLKVVITSALEDGNIEKMNKPRPITTNDYIQSHSCSNLRWVQKSKGPIKGIAFTKSYLEHRCPIVDGMSGSFMKLECGDKLGLFVNGGAIYRASRIKKIWNNKLWKKAHNDEILLFDEYKGQGGACKLCDSY